MINDGLDPSLACLPQCKPGCNHPFSCSSPPAFPGRQPCSASGRTETSYTAPQNVAIPSLYVCHRLGVFARARRSVALPKSKMRVFAFAGSEGIRPSNQHRFLGWNNKGQSVGTRANLDNELISAVHNRKAEETSGISVHVLLSHSFHMCSCFINPRFLLSFSWGHRIGNVSCKRRMWSRITAACCVVSRSYLRIAFHDNEN